MTIQGEYAMKTINVGLIGCGFMGRTHSNAYRQVGQFFDLDCQPVRRAICDCRQDVAKAFASRWGWQSCETDWKTLIARDDIDVIDIATPNHTHYEIALAAARAGKIVLCEKPLAMNAEQAREMVEAVESAGVANMTWFNYRRVPAVMLAKRILDEGRLGKIFHYRAQYLQDWTINPKVPQGGETFWRLDAALAGSGVTGDLLAHSIDLALWLAGDISSLTAMTETFIKQREVQGKPGTTQPVKIDDACACLARFASGAMGVFESTRYARGRKNFNVFEINGELGSLRFEYEDSHRLWFFDHTDDDGLHGWRNILVTDGDHPYMDHWWVPGCAIGYEHTFIHTLADFCTGLARGEKTCPDFRDALATQKVCDAILASANDNQWKTI